MTTKKDSPVLYRKYRPQKWDEVVGQDHVISVLQDSIKTARISHAYLFSGSRGTGKTTVARIFARSLDISPNDIYEIDAASNRGIDDVREIRDGVHVLPLESRYKIYIIDEAHMLTKEAFNALLKTLEEPPSHALFILATTETEKIPETVASRCQIFSFKKPTKDLLSDAISQTAKKEKISLEEGVADLIATLGDGSFRDTLGILQKILSSARSSKISLKDVESITGAPKGELVNNFIKHISIRDKEKALASIILAKEGNISMKFFISLILEKMRFVLLMKNSPDLAGYIKDHVSPDDLRALEEVSRISDKGGINSTILLAFLKAYDLTEKAYIDSLPLELAVIEVCG